MRNSRGSDLDQRTHPRLKTQRKGGSLRWPPRFRRRLKVADTSNVDEQQSCSTEPSQIGRNETGPLKLKPLRD